MAQSSQIIRYVTDGSLSMADSRHILEAQGVTVDLPEGGAVKFVPDDPTFPTTLFHPDGRIEMLLDTAESPRLGEYVKKLSSWLRVGLQPAE